MQSTPAQSSPGPVGAERVRNDQWHLRYMQVGAAHRLTRGNGVIVAVPDTGVHPHPDLAHNLLAGTDTVAGSGDGRADPNGHGTGMAGIIAAHGSGGDLGALGLAPEAKILPIRSSSEDNSGSPDDLAEGIEYAISHGADVISVSSTGGTSPRLTQAIRTALNSDIVVVAGSGNLPNNRYIDYPASEAGVIAVGGIGRDGLRAPISTTGPELDIVAPAVDIYSTSTNSKYRKGTGTSDSTAIIAGVAALVRSKYPDMPASEVAHRLTATAVDKGPPGRDDEYGYGVIDLVAALTADVPPLGFESSTVTPPPDGAPPTTAAEGDGEDTATARGLVTLGVLAAAGGGYLVWRRRRRADDPPPRISR
ncbi:type VII secretion-associated serine protease mycosin [Micromonospora coxensis]